MLIDLNPSGRAQTKKRRPIVPITNSVLPFVKSIQTGHLVQFNDRPVESIRTTWSKAIELAGLEANITPMTIRRTMARELRRRGVQPWDLAGLMGHTSNESTTEIYAEYDPGYLKEAVEAIDSCMTEIFMQTDTKKLRATSSFFWQLSL